MTRERFMALQLQALRSLKADMEQHLKNPLILSGMREDMESQYKILTQKLCQWEQDGFWTPENEKKYAEKYRDAAE